MEGKEHCHNKYSCFGPWRFRRLLYFEGCLIHSSQFPPFPPWRRLLETVRLHFCSHRVLTLFCNILSHISSPTAFDIKTAASAVIPAAVAAPAFALDSVVDTLPSNTLALEVQFGAYLAILLGTFLPCLFLINLYIQTESRKAGREGGQDSE